MRKNMMLAAPFLAVMAFVCQPAMSEDTAVDRATNEADRAVNDAGNELERAADRAADAVNDAEASTTDAARDASDIARDDAATEGAATDDAQPAAARDAAAGEENAQEAAGRDSAQKGNKDKKFAKKAADMNAFEIQAGQLATEKAQDQQIKQFAQMVVDDHTRAQEKLMQIVQSKQWQIDSQQLMPVHQAMLNELQKLEGQEFDRAFLYGQIAGHTKATLKLRDAKKECQDQELQAYAAEALPKVRQHLKQAQRIAGASDATTAAAGEEGEEQIGDDAAAQPAAGQDPGAGAGQQQDAAENTNTDGDQ